MKKLLSITMTLITLCVLFVGCSNNNPAPSNPPSDTPSTFAPDSSQDQPPASTPDPTGNQPSGQGSVNADDYWVSDTEFDIIGFCAAHGLDKFTTDETTITLSHSELQANGKNAKATRIKIGALYIIEATRDDYVNLQSILFTANRTEQEWQDGQQVTFTGTDVCVYPNRMDFILYVIPRLLDESIEDPMQGFGYPHEISRAEIKVTASGSYDITHGINVETVND